MSRSRSCPVCDQIHSRNRVPCVSVSVEPAAVESLAPVAVARPNVTLLPGGSIYRVRRRERNLWRQP